MVRKITFVLFGIIAIITGYIGGGYGGAVWMGVMSGFAITMIATTDRAKGMTAWQQWIRQFGDLVIMVGIPSWVLLIFGSFEPGFGVLCVVMLIYLAMMFFYELEYAVSYHD